MRARRTITVVGCHAGGEVGNVVVGGVLPPAGATVFEQMQSLRADDSLRRMLLREPRGSVAVHANLIVPPTRADCDAGYIIMEPTEYPAMSGSNTICVATVLLETGMVEMREPENPLGLEAPAGVGEVAAAWGVGAVSKKAVVVAPGRLDRSATGTGLSARLAALHARGVMRAGDAMTHASVIGSTFEGRIVSETTVGGRPAIVPAIRGSAWITGITQLMVDPRDPFPEGYLLSDTWGVSGRGDQ